MITSIEITRLRGIREGKLADLTPLVVLVGPNGCGKSTILDAMLIGASREVARNIGRAVSRHPGVRQGVRWLFWRLGTHGAPQIKIATNGKHERSCELSSTEPPERGHCDVRCKIDIGDGAKVHSANVRFPVSGKFGVLGEPPCHWPVDEFPGVRIIEAHREDPERPLHDLLTETIEQGVFDHAMVITAQVVPDVKDIRILTEGENPIVQLVYDDHSVPVALSGDGVYSLLRVSLILATYPQGTVLIEEPEVHQHPGAIRQSVRAILAAVRREIQVVITTHSIELIDAILAESSDEDLEKLSLYRLQLENGSLISHRLPGAEVAFSRTEVEKDLR